MMKIYAGFRRQQQVALLRALPIAMADSKVDGTFTSVEDGHSAGSCAVLHSDIDK